MTRDIAVGKYIATLREQARLKQAELARKLTWSPAVLSRVESGERTLGGDELARVARAVESASARLSHQTRLLRTVSLVSAALPSALLRSSTTERLPRLQLTKIPPRSGSGPALI